MLDNMNVPTATAAGPTLPLPTQPKKIGRPRKVQPVVEGEAQAVDPQELQVIALAENLIGKLEGVIQSNRDVVKFIATCFQHMDKKLADFHLEAVTNGAKYVRRLDSLTDKLVDGVLTGSRVYTSGYAQAVPQDASFDVVRVREAENRVREAEEIAEVQWPPAGMEAVTVN